MSGGSALSQIAAEFGFSFDTAALAKGDSAIGKMIGRVGALGTVLAAGSGVAAVLGFADSFAQQANEVRNASTELGIGTDQLQAMRLGFADAGVSSEELTGALRRLNRSIGAAAHGSKQQAAALGALGVHARGAHGEIGTLSDMLPEIMDGFQHMTNPTDAASRATQLFGRAGGRLVPILRRGRAGLADMNAELARLGGGISQRAIESAHRYEEAQHRLDVTTMGLKSSVAEGLLPVLEGLIRSGTAFVAQFHAMTDNTEIVKHTLQGLGVVGAVVGVELLLPWVPLLAALAIGILLYDDLATTIGGGDSATRDFIDSQFGVGTTADIVRDLRGAWLEIPGAIDDLNEDIANFLDNATHDVGAFVDWFPEQWNAIGESFDTMWDRVLARIAEGLNRVGALASRAGRFLHSSTLQDLGSNSTMVGGIVQSTVAESARQREVHARQREVHARWRRDQDEMRGQVDAARARARAQAVDRREQAVAQVSAGTGLNAHGTADQPPPVQHITHHHAPVHIAVNGSGLPPHELARVVEHAVRAAQANDADADHPVAGVH